MNWARIKHLAGHYAYGLFASAWNGGVGAVAGILGIDSASLTGALPDARILNAHEMVAAFGGAFLMRGIIWLASHPLPASIETTPPFGGDQIKP